MITNPASELTVLGVSRFAISPPAVLRVSNLNTHVEVYQRD